MYYSMKSVAQTLILTHFEAHREDLVKIARRKLGDMYSEDAVQDVYERCLRYEDRIPLALSLDKFIMTVLMNRIRDYQREVVPHDEIEEHMWESGDLAKELRSKGVLKEVMSELERYDEQDRTVLYLYLIQGESSYDVSRITGVGMANVRKLAERFRAVVKEKYEIE